MHNVNDALKSILDRIAEPLRCALSSRYRRERRRQKREIRDRAEREAQYQYFKSLSPDQYPEALKKWYKKRTKKTLNLENPQTYNEKIQWLKLYDSTPLKTRLADKYLVRGWIAEKIGEEYLIPLLGVYDKFDDIDFDKLPEKFVIKTNHDSGSYRIVTDKSKFDVAEARNFFNEKMRTNFAFWAGLQLHYKNIVPKIIIEKYLENSDNDLHDYKFWCFNGEVKYIEFMSDRKKRLKVTYYDPELNRMPFGELYPQHESDIEKPDNLKHMINLAEKLAAGFSHVRVDFYRLNDGTIKFGEMTFTPSNGTVKWNPPEYDKIIGDLIKLPEKREIPK